MQALEFVRRLGIIALAGIALAVLLRLLLGARVFGLYGVGVIVIATLPAMTHAIQSRLGTLQWSRWWALVYALPAGLYACLTLAFWLTFVHGPMDVAVQLGMVRLLLCDAARPFQTLGLGALAAVTTLLFAALVRRSRVM